MNVKNSLITKNKINKRIVKIPQIIPVMARLLPLRLFECFILNIAINPKNNAKVADTMNVTINPVSKFEYMIKKVSPYKSGYIKFIISSNCKNKLRIPSEIDTIANLLVLCEVKFDALLP